MGRKVPVWPARLAPSVRVTLKNDKPFVCSALENAYQACVRLGLTDVRVARDDYGAWVVRASVTSIPIDPTKEPRSSHYMGKAGELEPAMRYLFGAILDPRERVGQR